MSYYYGYYDYYGTDYSEAVDDYIDAVYDAYYEDAPVEAEDDGEKSMMMPILLWSLGAGTSIFAGLETSDDAAWDNAGVALLGNGVFRLVALGAGLAVPAIHDQWLIVSALTLFGSLYGMYTINDANGTTVATNVNTIYGLTAVSVLVSAAFIAMPMDKDADVEDDYYYGDYYYGDYYGDYSDYYSEGDDYYGDYGYYGYYY